VAVIFVFTPCDDGPADELVVIAFFFLHCPMTTVICKLLQV